jgi:hypothetical protein
MKGACTTIIDGFFRHVILQDVQLVSLFVAWINVYTSDLWAILDPWRFI